MVARVFPGATTGRWLARPPCHCVSRQREGGWWEAGDTFADVACEDRGWGGIAGDDREASACVVARVVARSGARAELAWVRNQRGASTAGLEATTLL